MKRRSFLRGSSALFISSAAAPLSIAPSIARAWVAEAIAVVQIAYSLYVASQDVGRGPDVKLGLLFEVLAQVRSLHQQVTKTNEALGQIILLLVEMPKQIRRSFRDELDDFAADELVSGCQSLIEEVQRLQADFAGQPVSDIPETRLRDLRDALNTVRDRRNTLFLRSDLSALALCSAAIVELSAERFLGLSKDAAEVTGFAYLRKFVKMESKTDPTSLHSIFRSMSRYSGFTRNAIFPRVFSAADLRPEILNEHGFPTGEHQDVIDIDKYVASQIYYQEVEFIPMQSSDFIYYTFTDGKRFHTGEPYIKCTGNPCGTGKGVRDAGLDFKNIPIEMDHYCVALSLDVIQDQFDPSVNYTTVAKANLELKVETDKNSVTADKQLQYLDDYSTALSLEKKPNPWAALGEDNDGNVAGPSDILVTTVCKTGEADRVTSRLGKVVEIAERDDVVEVLTSDLEAARRDYNNRVHLVRALAAMIAVVDRTSEEVRGRIKEWNA